MLRAGAGCLKQKENSRPGLTSSMRSPASLRRDDGEELGNRRRFFQRRGGLPWRRHRFLLRSLMNGLDCARRRHGSRRGQVIIGRALREGAQLIALRARGL